jgi:hypothetical protein
LTHGIIKTKYVFVYHYHNLPIHDNNVMVNNDPKMSLERHLLMSMF